MRYLADILTFSRLFLAIMLLVWTIIDGPAEGALIFFLVGELTDAFDGFCSVKWPFPKNQTPKYRKYAAKYDIFIDTLLAVMMIIYYIVRINLVVGLVIGISCSVYAIIIDLIVYGKLLGHPDNYRRGALISRNFPLAKSLILFRRSIYIIGIAVVSILTLIATGWPPYIKYSVLIVSTVVAIFLWFFQRQRRHNISRDAVEIEQKLTKKAHK